MPPTITPEPTVIERLCDLRASEITESIARIDAREAVEVEFEARMASDTKPTDEEIKAHGDARAAYRSDLDLREASISDLNKRIGDQENKEQRLKEAAERSARITIVHEPMTYRRDNAHERSYYRDLALASVEGLTLQASSRSEAIERLGKHRAELEVEMPKRAKAREERARRQIEEAENTTDLDSPFKRGAVYAPSRRWSSTTSPFERRIEPNRTDGEGGYLIPPVWLIDTYIPGLRAHLIAANICRRLDLPAGTDSINVPKLKTLTAVGYQQADNSGVVSKDWTDTVVSAKVKTIAGQSDVALQLLEQSPHMIVDEVITTDLMAAYNTFLDQQLLAGDGVNASQLNGGHLLGIYPQSNWTARAVAWTTATPVGTNFVDVLGAMASQVARNRYTRENYKVVLHGRRWFWYASSRDLNGRPLVEPDPAGPWNVAANLPDSLPAEGLAGCTNTGDPVYIDDNVPIVATNDVGISALWDDVWLFEGEQRMNVYREVLSGSLGVRFQTYNYAANLVRYGQSLCVATGTGFVAPKGKSVSVLF